jgi:aminopeptidase N
VVANGRLRGKRQADGMTTWTWDAEPMASYLATVAIGQFNLRSYQEDGVTFVDAVDVDLGDPSSIQVLDRQPDVLAFFADRFGPYPFDSAGAMVDDAEFSFALETQTRPIYSELAFLSGDATLVHELAHQWFGDSVRLASWDHIWLNEGFATYAEWLWREAEGGPTAQRRFDTAYEQPESEGPWDMRIGDPGAENMFAPQVYERGAMTLHALRTVVGEQDFTRILRRWATTEAGKAVTTDDLVALAEEVSGKPLDDLFDAWLYTAGKPDRP